VKIKYKPGGEPKVWVLQPEIIMSSRTHVYKEGNLCLYFPRDEPWMEGDLISKKIIPWTAEWLIYYELFLITGDWLGPEAPHSPN